jgi:hypothetical protein
MFLRQEGSFKKDPDYNIYVGIKDKVDPVDKSAHRINTCGPFHAKPPDKEHDQNVHINNQDQLAADLQIGDSFDSLECFDGKDPDYRIGIRSLGDGSYLPPPEPNPPQARVDLCAATADENTDCANPKPGNTGPDSQLDFKSELQEPPPKKQPARASPGYTAPPTSTRPPGYANDTHQRDCKDLATGPFRHGRTNTKPGLYPLPLQARDNPQPGIKLGIKFAVNLPENGRTSSAPNYIRPPRGYQVPSYIMPPGYIRPPSSPVTPVYTRVPGFTAPTNNSPFKRGGTTGGPHPKRAAAN